MKVFVITSQARGFEAVAATKEKAEDAVITIQNDLRMGGHYDNRVYIKETTVLQ